MEQRNADLGLEQRLSFSERYENLGLIGSGGQGKVYRVQEKTSGTILAAKRIGLDSWEEVRRLEDEVRALQQLQHPTIVAYEGSYAETDRWNDPEFILLMEHVDGKPLAQYLAEGRHFSEEELCSIQKQLVAGLSHAHEQGIVHRDIKPHNILLKADGTVKITDYGLAKFLNEGTRSTSLGKGTIYYMAPEQITGGKITPATDYYGMGLTLLSLAMGKEREDDIRHQKPKEDIAKLRSQKRYSSVFLDSLELLVDEDVKKRKNGLVVKEPEAVVEPTLGDLETVVGGKKTYEELVKWEKANSVIYAFMGILGGGLGIIASQITVALSGNFDLANPAGTFMLGLTPAGGYLGYKLSKVVNWRRRRKAEKAAGVTTIKRYDAKDGWGSKKTLGGDTLQGVPVGEDHYIISTDDLKNFISGISSEGMGYNYYRGSKDLSFAYRILDYNQQKKRAKVETITNKSLLKKIQEAYEEQDAPRREEARRREHEEILLPGPWRRPDPIHTVRVPGESATPRKSPKTRGKGSVNWTFADEIFGPDVKKQYKRAKAKEKEEEAEASQKK